MPSLTQARVARIEKVLREQMPIPCMVATDNSGTTILDDAWVKETATRIARLRMSAATYPKGG